MANPAGKCIVCGRSPTIKAHLFPRALMLDIRDDAPQLVAGRRDQAGVLLSQNGQWDDTLLCDQHERVIGAGDDYAVRFIRKRLPTGKRPTGGMVEVENPTPDKLLHFAYAVVWRHALSKSGRDSGLQLADYEKRILNTLLSNGPYDLELLVSLNPITLKNAPIRLAIPPYRERMPLGPAALNVWHFTICGLDFYLKTDGRQFPVRYRPYLANGNDPLLLSTPDAREIHEVPKLRPILQGMMRSTWLNPENGSGNKPLPRES